MSAARYWTALALAITSPGYAQVAPATVIEANELAAHGDKYNGTRIRLNGMWIMGAHGNTASAYLTATEFAVIDIGDVPNRISSELLKRCAKIVAIHVFSDVCRFDIEADVFIVANDGPFLRRTVLLAAPLPPAP